MGYISQFAKPATYDKGRFFYIPPSPPGVALQTTILATTHFIPEHEGLNIRGTIPTSTQSLVMKLTIPPFLVPVYQPRCEWAIVSEHCNQSKDALIENIDDLISPFHFLNVVF